MAKSKKAVYGQQRGRIGNSIWYPLNGKTVTREIGINNKPPTILQLTVQMKTKIISQVFTPFQEFLKVGFALVAKKLKINHVNAAVSYNWKSAIKGSYPNLEVDFSKLQLSAGLKPLPGSLVMNPTVNGIEFLWDKRPIPGVLWSDRAMLMAYFPDLKRAIFNSTGSMYNTGRDELLFYNLPHDTAAEIYISFIADNRRSISDSIYLGSLIW